MARQRWLLGLGALGMAVGCGGDRDETPGVFSSSIGASGIGGDDDGDTEGATESGDDDDDDNDNDDDDDDDKLDLPEPQMPTDSCYAVDLLFVIDNSGSMCDEQEGLASVVPDLVDAMFESLPEGTDLHVGIVTTSFSQGGEHQEAQCAATEGPAIIEDAYITDQVVQGNGYQGRLFEYDGVNYFAARTHDESARDDLTTWFSGAIVEVGCSGGAFDFPAAAAAYAAHPNNDASNSGFLRDAGAALALFLLTNETDHSPEGIATYRDMLLDAKAECGGAECIVTGGLLAPNCVPDWDPPVWQFLSAFGGTPAWGDVGDFSTYGTVVAETLATGVVETCESIDPVG